jgi:Zn-finger nucleic acid-binding protein
MSPDAGALHCPNCGGPAAPGDAVCKYCHASLATISCAKCFGLMFQGAIYCPSCGARRVQREAGPRQAPCPACRGVMHEVQIGDTALLECERCHANWMDAASFEHACASREAQAAFLQHWPSAPPPAGSAAVHYRKCVACGKMMNRINFGRLSGTVVDICKGHGTLLDAGELHAIVTFVQGGGFDRARQAQIDDMKDEEERLRTAQSLHDGYQETSRSWTFGDVQVLLNRIAGK